MAHFQFVIYLDPPVDISIDEVRRCPSVTATRHVWACLCRLQPFVPLPGRSETLELPLVLLQGQIPMANEKNGALRAAFRIMFQVLAFVDSKTGTEVPPAFGWWDCTAMTESPRVRASVNQQFLRLVPAGCWPPQAP